MPDFSQSAKGIEPATVVDHVLLPVADLEEGSRQRPDGQVLRWRTQDVESGSDPTALPFVIEWGIPDGLHPGEAAALHRGGETALRRVVVGAREPGHVRDQLDLLL